MISKIDEKGKKVAKQKTVTHDTKCIVTFKLLKLNLEFQMGQAEYLNFF